MLLSSQNKALFNVNVNLFANNPTRYNTKGITNLCRQKMKQTDKCNAKDYGNNYC